MHILFTLGPIRFDYTTIISFFIGISFGFILLLLIYLYALLKSLNRNLKLKASDEEDIDEEEIKMLIKDAQGQFKEKSQRQSIGYHRYLLEINRDLSVDIAKKFYPRSKYPYLELTVDETLMLNHYITNRMEELLKGRILGLVRGMTLAKLVELNETKHKIDNNPIVKTAKKYNKVTKTVIGIVNAANPAYWTRRLTQDFVLNIVVVKIGLALIAITGEETYKIYSKKVFNQQVALDLGVDAIYDEIREEIEHEGKSSV